MLALAYFMLLASCSNTEDYQKISGEWECTSWINKVKEIDKCRNNVHFQFKEDKSYYSKLGSVEDSGSYKIQKDKLYVTPLGKMEMAVEITKLNNDTLEFLMNQGGEEEILTLIRKD